MSTPRYHHALTLAFGLLMIGCATNSHENEADARRQLERVRLRALVAAVVLASLALASVPAGAETWIALPGESGSPTETHMAPVKSGLRQHMQALAKQQGISMPAWDTYTIQYEGTIESGQRRITIRGSCVVPENLDPQRTPIIVLDGGPCFFFAVYDVATNSYVRAFFNGDA
jgi:hypothetical protein